MKNKNITKEMRDRHWKLATLILSIMLLILLANDIINHFSNEDNSLVQKSPEMICSEITGTPAWVYNMTQIISYGYNTFGITENLSVDKSLLVDDLIKDKIYFIYSSKCGHCLNQIEWFGDAWNIYKDSRMTIDCANLQ